MSDYSSLDKFFHRLTLKSATMGEMLFDLDSTTAGKSAAPVSKPVFVGALARAGTTVLMRALHGSGAFGSLTYADMPLVMAPNLWARLSGANKKERIAKERAHGDGVIVDFDAPEALEEVFWRTYHGPDYIKPDALIPHDIPADTAETYRRYQALVCHRYGRPRYLAKNNNVVLRLAPLALAQPDAVFLLPVRHPLAQAESLLNQHLRFAHADAFTADYMRWLVHHEFGPDHRPYRLPDAPPLQGVPERLDYWLSQWIAVYGHLEGLIDRFPDQLRPVIYEDLGAGPDAWAAIAAALDIPVGDDPGFRPATAPPAADGSEDPALLEAALRIYTRLRTRAAAA